MTGVQTCALPIWRVIVLAAVRAHDLEGYLLGTITPPPLFLPRTLADPGDIPNPAFLQWQRLDQFLFHWLLNSITESMIGHVLNCNTAAEVWHVLARIFATKSKARLLQIQGLLQSTKKGSDSVDDYILKMKGFANSLSAAGEQISEESLCLYILGGLGPEFEATVVTLTNRSEPLNVQDVQFSLHNQEMRLQQQASASLELAQANFAGMSLRGNQRPPSRGGRSGNRGGRGSTGGRGNRNNRPTCQLCGRIGHVVQKCYHRFDKHFNGPAPSASTSSSPNSDQAQSYISESTLGDDSPQSWVLDTGATNHITPDVNNLASKGDYKGKAKVIVGNGNSMNISHIGSNSFHASHIKHAFTLHDILHVPNASKNLLSISKFTRDNNIVLEFDSVCCLIKDKRTKQVLLKGSLIDGLYHLSIRPSSSSQSQFDSLSSSAKSSVNAFHSTTTSNPVVPSSLTSRVWHCRLGHPSHKVLCKVLSSVNPSLSVKECSFCDACQIGKLHQIVFKPSINKSVHAFDLIYSDVWGPSFHPSVDGYRYYLSFVDDFTSFTWIYPMHTKSQVTTIFPQFNAYVERCFNTKIKCIQTDMGSEYKPLYKLLADLGIQRRHSCPHTHQQQGKIERKHRHVVDIGLTLLAQAQMPLKFWWEAFASATYLINRLPTHTLEFLSPFQCLHGKPPDYNLLKTFGCSCYPLLRPYNTHKMSFRSSKCLFLGYSSLHKGYRCMNSSGRIYLARSVKFNETEFPYESMFQTNASQSSLPVLQSPGLYPIPSLPQTATQSPINREPSTSPLINPVSSSRESPGASPSMSNVSVTPSSSPAPLMSTSPNIPQQIPISDICIELPIPPVPNNTHPMQTRSKHGIFKPKALLSVALHELEPLSFKNFYY